MPTRGARLWARFPVLAMVLGAAGCETGPSRAERAALAETEQGAALLGRTLRARVAEAMEQGGPMQGVKVCAEEAQQLTRQAQEQSGVSVGRSSLRLRNPANAGPEWVTVWLQEQGERPAEGVAPVARVVDTPAGRRAQVIKPIAVEGPCVVCHGPTEAIAPEVRELLEQRYPRDRAVGYAAGDLRGALWAESPVR